jgi:RNA polymerase sigma factor (sigma-70 family)
VNAFSLALSDVFTRGAERRLDLETERETIALAKGGDTDATIALVYAYAPALRGAVGQYRHAGGGSSDSGSLDVEDLRQAAILGFLEAISAFDPEQHQRLAALVTGYVADALTSSGAGPVAFTVPPRTLTRFYGILRAAGGDPVAAAELAPTYHMTSETFSAVLAAVREADSYDVLVAAQAGGDTVEAPAASLLAASPGPTIADAEERILVEAAFAAVGPLEESVVRLAYGFADYEALSDAEVAFRLGLSRPTAQRTRTGALVTMRSALGVA